MIYLDNAATTYPKPEIVYEAVLNHMRGFGANPGRSGHKLAIEAGRVIFKGRELVCKLFNIDNPMQVVFTSNATESLNLGIKGVLKPGDHVITTSMEHNSVLRPIKALESIGVENTIVECYSDGSISVKEIEAAIKRNTKLIVMTHASNVTGTLMPIGEIGQIAKNNNILFLVDAAQTAGVYDIDVNKLNIDILALPGHKGLLGPQGTGILYIREGIDVMHFKEGGTGSKSEELTQPEMMPDRYESGTPNTPGIAGLAKGIEFILSEGVHKIRRHEEELTKYFLDELSHIKEVKVYGVKDASKQAAVVSLNIGEEDSSEIAYILDKAYDIAVRPGLHCAPVAHKTIGSFEQGTVRFSIGYFNTKEDIDKVVTAIKDICQQL
ncbi:aminotransferase class V-fold PLP-dependent enzyme [Alkaliphilus peptidifermentans]|uniref:cysteine desulfurase n=1 Tax=Alkaliphilus peptidifermentans DSM 18978 TaxID=1120976 RepID=A0A1G5HFX8_9FIRM|nr:aminotransferase class V-fold PLP-dependent enzyme [Alkaliphilus peptidifermentans]SCY62673.1 cysteine desulfurase family protein [Alkaliphilus peptidifermentans DSM 18978]